VKTIYRCTNRLFRGCYSREFNRKCGFFKKSDSMWKNNFLSRSFHRFFRCNRHILATLRIPAENRKRKLSTTYFQWSDSENR